MFNEKVDKKELKWEISSTIGKYDNIYKIEFKTINDQGAVQGEICKMKPFSTEIRIQSREMLLDIHGRKWPSSGPIPRRMDHEVPLGSEAREEIKLDYFLRSGISTYSSFFLVLIFCPLVQ